MATTDTTSFAVRSAFLPYAASKAIAEMLDGLRQSVVQVRSGERGAGTGMVWRPDGVILTNYHVIAHARGAAQALLADGRLLEARVVDANPALDLALLEVPAKGLSAVTVGDSSRLRVGELVFALGHPWGERWVATAGIVSGLGAFTPPHHDRRVPFVRSDVRLAPGNSGGPLLNAQGEVVGINAMVFGGDLGVAIASQVASEWAVDAGRRLRLGVEVQPVELPVSMRMPGRAGGLMVTAVEPGGPAEKAQVMVGDVLLDVDGVPVNNGFALWSALRPGRGRDRLHLTVLRGGASRAIEVPLAA